jgi:hypothetical protein
MSLPLHSSGLTSPGGGLTILHGGLTSRHGGRTVKLNTEQSRLAHEHQFCFNVEIFASYIITDGPCAKLLARQFSCLGI